MARPVLRGRARGGARRDGHPEAPQRDRRHAADLGQGRLPDTRGAGRRRSSVLPVQLRLLRRGVPGPGDECDGPVEPGLRPRDPGVDERPKLPVVYAGRLDRLSRSRQHDAANAGQVALRGTDDAGHAPTLRVDHEPLGGGGLGGGHVLEPSVEGARVRSSGGQLRAGWRRPQPWRRRRRLRRDRVRQAGQRRHGRAQEGPVRGGVVAGRERGGLVGDSRQPRRRIPVPSLSGRRDA
eukprot:SAG31_NODE_1604_length_7767_cov_4.103808_2_plen_237_part_00